MNSIFLSQKGKLTEQRSKFLSFVFPCESLEEQANLIKKMRSEYPSATHICYASIVDNGKIECYFSDDGEPCGTAGVPMLNVLKEHQLVNVIAFVVRFFGGIKLGTAGLAKAYKDATILCLNSLVEVEKKEHFVATCSYENFDKIKKIALKNGDTIGNVDFFSEVKFSLFTKEEDAKLYSISNSFVDTKSFKYVEKK